MTKEAISTERALRLALEALDYIRNFETEVTSQTKYGNAAQVIEEALASEALDRMSENARELGLDYGVEQDLRVFARIDAMRAKGLLKLTAALEQPAPVAEPRKLQPQPVGYVAENGVVDWNVCAPPIMTDLYTTPQPAQPQQEPVATVIGKFLTRKDELRTCIEPELPLGTKLYTSPPTLSLAQSGREALEAAHTRLQKKYGELEGKVRRTWVGLTDEEVSKMPAWIYSPDQDGMTAEEGLEVFARAIEANLKEKNSD